MYRGIKKVFLIVLILAAGNLFALDLTFIGGTGNFSFDSSLTAPIGGINDFKGKFYPLATITVADQITDTFGYTATAGRDPLLRNTISSEMTIDGGFIKLSVGPLFSVFNSWSSYIRPGVTTSLGLQFAGYFFINLRGGATFGSSMENTYALETSRIALGFWLPNLVGTISFTTKKFSEFKTSLIQDELLRISYRTDIYAKNSPYTVSIDMGYQALKRSYTGVGEDLMRQVFLGIETNIDITGKITLIAGAEIPVFAWGKVPLMRAKKSWYFEAFAGITWKIQKRDQHYSPMEVLEEE